MAIWTRDNKAKAKTAQFSTSDDSSLPLTDVAPARIEGNEVIRTGKFFECDRAFKAMQGHEFSISAAEADAILPTYAPPAENEPGNINIEHVPTVLDGLLGRVRKLWRDGKDILAEYAIPLPLHELTKGEPIRISSEWHTETKMPLGAALVLRPAVRDAVMMAAFADRSAMQRHHDMAVEHGAECGGTALFAEVAGFMTPAELKAIQHIHDYASQNGASCDAYATRRSMTYYNQPAGHPEDRTGNKETHDMTVWEKLKALFKEAGVPVDEEIADGKKADPKPEPTSDKSAFSDELKALFAAQNEQIAKLREDLAASRQQADVAKAESRVRAAVAAFKLLPSKREGLVELAKTNMAAFSAAMDAIEANGPVIALAGHPAPADAQALMAGAGDESQALDALTKQRATEKKISYAAAASEIIAERPDLARAHFSNRPVYSGRGEGN